jgi:hypothetical protein
MLKVRKNHPYDGTQKAGKPEGPIFDVKEIKKHDPIDGTSNLILYLLSDNSYSFSHNVTEVLS